VSQISTKQQATLDVIVTPNVKHVTDSNVTDVIDIAGLVDHLISSYDVKQNLYNSMHAPPLTSIVNLPL